MWVALPALVWYRIIMRACNAMQCNAMQHNIMETPRHTMQHKRNTNAVQRKRNTSAMQTQCKYKSSGVHESTFFSETGT